MKNRILSSAAGGAFRAARTAGLAAFSLLVLTGVSARAQGVKMLEFTEQGTDTVATTAAKKIPADATMVRQASAPLNDNGDVVLLNLYKKGEDLFLDALTAKSGQPAIAKNHIKLKSPLPMQPDQITFGMRYIGTEPHRGILIVGKGDAGSLAIVLPRGFGGVAYQQLFLTADKKGVQRSYDFVGNDSRGFAIVKASVDSSGTVKPVDDVKFYVWNGKEFIPRKAN